MLSTHYPSSNRKFTIMGFNELRKDYLLDRWVVIATERGRRPTDFVKKQTGQTPANTATCPMCPGNEHMTPPAVLIYQKKGKSVRKTKDKGDVRQKDWLIRTVPNLYPAFSPPTEKTNLKQIMKSHDLAQAVGHHEVIIESPNHDEHPADARIPQLILVINAYISRLRELSKKPYVKYVSIFRNHGLEAGASLSHAHSQIIATPFIPKTVQEEMKASKRYWSENGKCVFCDILKKERKSSRFILENPYFTVFAPYASINPLEFWILPKKHQTTLQNMTKPQIQTFAQTLKTSLGALKKLVNDPPYNYGIHLAVDENASKYYHWHLEVYPKLAIWAGFEKSTGIYINTVTPEATAESLRKIV
jgi:UDPglucose--hexose-1-phosphate uridylyltransferase